MYCTKCGNQISGNFCSRCGTPKVNQKVNVPIESNELAMISKMLSKFFVTKLKKSNNAPETILQFVDLLDGTGFEDFCAFILLELGMFTQVEQVGKSGDNGVDIIAHHKEGDVFGIQCKCYSNNIGNDAIQQIYTGIKLWNCDVGVVMTNQMFTDSAVATAQITKICLWDRNCLYNFISMIAQKYNSDIQMSNREKNRSIYNDGMEEDAVVIEAIKVIIEAGQASPSLLQRRLGIGYMRATQLLDKLEHIGIIGAYDGNKPRELLITIKQ